MTDSFTRSSRRFVSEDAPKRTRTSTACPGFLGSSQQFCSFASRRTARATSRWTSSRRAATSRRQPRGEKFVYEYVKEVITHEVGHRSACATTSARSTIFTAAQIADPEFTAKNG
jgi:hypothetical protein